MAQVSSRVDSDMGAEPDPDSTSSRRMPGEQGRQRTRQMLVMWLAIYPALTLALWAFEELGWSRIALPLRTLILTAVLVPTMVQVLIPGVSYLLRRTCGLGPRQE